MTQRGSADQSLLCYVLDIVQAPGVLQRRGEDSLRWILENTHIVKSMHCCRGDTAALYGEFGIRRRASSTPGWLTASFVRCA